MNREIQPPMTLADVLKIPEEHLAMYTENQSLIPLELSMNEMIEIATEKDCDTNWAIWNGEKAVMVHQRRKRPVAMCPLFYLGEEGKEAVYVPGEWLNDFKIIFMGEGAVG